MAWLVGLVRSSTCCLAVSREWTEVHWSMVVMTMWPMMIERRTLSSMAASLAMAATSTASSKSTSGVLGIIVLLSSPLSEELTERISLISIKIWIGTLHILINDGEHSFRNLARKVYLQERVRVVFSLLALRTEVEVLADTTLVSHAHDRVAVAPIAGYTCVDNFLRLFG